MWTPEEWAAQPTMTSDADDDDGDGSAPMLAGAAEPMGAKTDAEAIVAESALPAALAEPIVNNSMAEATNVVSMSNGDAVEMLVASKAPPDVADHAAPVPAGIPAAEMSEPPQSAASGADNTAAQESAPAPASAVDDQTPATVAETTEAEASVAAVPAVPAVLPSAAAAKAAPAPKALTVKERLAACVATERHRITFGKVQNPAACYAARLMDPDTAACWPQMLLLCRPRVGSCSPHHGAQCRRAP